MPEPIVHNPKANAIAKGVKQFSNVEKICWGRVSGLGNSPQGKVYDSMQVYLPLLKIIKLGGFTPNTRIRIRAREFGNLEEGKMTDPDSFIAIKVYKKNPGYIFWCAREQPDFTVTVYCITFWMNQAVSRGLLE